MSTARILDEFLNLPATARVLAEVRRGQHRAAGGLWGSSAALLIGALLERWAGPVLLLDGEAEDAALLEGDLQSFTEQPLLTLAAQEIDVEGAPDPLAQSRRLGVLRAVALDARWRLAASVGAMLDPAPSRAAMDHGGVALAVGARLRQAELLERALAAGMRRAPIVLAPGEVVSRGDVLDLWPMGSAKALRLEFLDDELESIRSFDPASQRSLGLHDTATLVLADDLHEATTDVVEHLLRPDLLVIRHEPLRIAESSRAATMLDSALAKRWQRLEERLANLTRLDVSALPSHDLDFKILSAGSAVGSGEADPAGRLRSIRGPSGRVHVLCRTDDERRRLAEIFAHKGVSLAAERVQLAVGASSRGFRIPELSLTVLSNVEFAGVPAPVRVRMRKELPTRAVQSFFELGPGDVVVHAVHGLALFEGIERVQRGEAAEDHLRLCFQDDVRLLVPASKIHLVQKYVGAGNAHPRLDKLGGKGFQRRKEEVEAALYDMAADLLEVQSQREALEREPFPHDPLEEAFLDAFPFTDTPDQARAWREIQGDLESRRPMDRLLCGDVGFGKTELAMRAAFKVALRGRQVAVLVPTTLLADQHARTFGERFAPHGLTVEWLSRYRMGAERRKVLEGLAAGTVDLVVGTHRLLGGDVAFKDLGLVVIDEEQRFGVRHKEHLKRLRLHVDVLTLSATPIPRTLHASLLGIRDISTLATPPPGRQDIETRVALRDPHLLQHAIERELARDGQVFVLHNHIASIDHVAKEVRRLVPRARVAVGHGQMTEAQMEHTVRAFVRGQHDVLVCTTIVENGLDIPRANTLLVDRADLFGLADLHQLRGRIGRSERLAYCYLLIDPAQPVAHDARVRLKAIEEFAHLGAGFAIAMKDLEIRGAGNLLGPQQSGHIAAVGYDMYCRLLRAAVESAKTGVRAAPMVQEVDVDLRLDAYLPETFVGDAKARLDCLREMDEAKDPASAEEIRRSLTDRFGKLPAPVENLLQVFLLKHQLAPHGVLAIQLIDEHRLVARHPRGQPLGGAWLDAFDDVRAVEAGKTHLILPERRTWKGTAVLQFLLDALLDRRTSPTIAPR